MSIPSYRVRRIDQYVVPLPTNGEVARDLMRRILNDNQGVPLDRVKITLDDAAHALLVSVPVDWTVWRTDADAESYGVDEDRI